MRAFEIHTFRIGGYDLSGDLSCDFQDLVIRIDGICIVLRCIVELILVPVVPLLELADALHHRIVQMIAQFRVFCIEICHIICCVIYST